MHNELHIAHGNKVFRQKKDDAHYGVAYHCCNNRTAMSYGDAPVPVHALRRLDTNNYKFPLRFIILFENTAIRY